MTAFVSLTETRQAAETVYGGPQRQLLLPTGWQLDMSFNEGAGDAGASAGGYAYALKSMEENTAVGPAARMIEKIKGSGIFYGKV